MSYTASYFSMGIDPAFALGSSLPFGPNARLQRSWFYAGGLDLSFIVLFLLIILLQRVIIYYIYPNVF